MVWTEYPAGAIKCVDVTIIAARMLTLLSDRWCKVSLKHCSASLLPSIARSSRRMYIRHHIRPLNLIVPASYQDGVGVTVPTVTLARKVGPGVQDLQTRARRILAERNAEKAEENTWIGRMVAAENINDMKALIKSRDSV